MPLLIPLKKQENAKKTTNIGNKALLLSLMQTSTIKG